MSDGDPSQYPDATEVLEHYQHAYENVDGVGLARRMTPAERALHAEARQAMRKVIENLQHRIDNGYTGADGRPHR